MKIDVRAGDSLAGFENLIVLSSSDGGPDLGERSLPEEALFARLRERGDFSAKRGKVLCAYSEDGSLRWALAGLGPSDGLGPRAWRDAAAAAQKVLAALGAKEAALLLPAEADAGEIAFGLLLSGYKYDRFISNDDKKGKRLERVTLLLPEGADPAPAQEAVNKASIIASGTRFARDLLCAPGNLATPAHLAREAERIAADSGGRITTRVIGEEELEQQGFRALLAVGQGSEEESRLIVLDYDHAAGENTAQTKTVALVGKGVTFDAGGISLKPPALMDEMKYDMGGAAAVLGVFRALAEMDLPLRVLGLVPSVENMPGGRAYRPGDIIVARSGLSIEVKNTDAEGRLILADALDYAKEFEPDLVIDLATLTGACVVALAHEAAAVMANEGGEPYVDALRACGERTGERVWPMPMYDEYADLLKSDFADLKNTGGRYGGAIIAGKFLQRFADPAPWVHLDIAGTAWTEKERGPVPKVGTGFGVRLLLDFLGSLD